MLEILLLEWNFLRISPSSLSYHFCAYEPHADFSAWTGPLQGRFSYRTRCPSVVLQWRAYQIWTIFNAEYSTYSGERKRETDTFLIRESLWTALKKSYAHSPALSPTLSLSSGIKNSPLSKTLGLRLCPSERRRGRGCDWLALAPSLSSGAEKIACEIYAVSHIPPAHLRFSSGERSRRVRTYVRRDGDGGGGGGGGVDFSLLGRVARGGSQRL